MVWKHLKKPAILVASLALAVGIAPMAAFADETVPEGADGGNQGAPELTAQELNEIDSINLNIAAPIAGKSSANPPQATTTDAGYTILNEKNHWINPDTGEMLNTTFVEGESYDAMIWLTLNEGYAIAGGNIRSIPVNIENGEFKSIDGEGYDVEIGNIIEVWAKVKAAAAPKPAPDDEPAADEPAATEPESTEPAATEPTPAATDTETTAAETATATQATTSSTNTTASTLPKTSDALPVALFGGIALMSGLVLAMAWRLRKN